MQTQGPATPVTEAQRIRYQACVNTSNYDAPPHAVMSRVYLNGTGGTVVDGNWVLHVDRPDSIIAARQSAADLVFNGPEVLKAGKPGRCTEDFPCRGLHLREDTLHQRPFVDAIGLGGTVTASIYCGPRADSWLLWDSGIAFRWLHRDASALLNDKFETGLIVPTTPPYVGGQFHIARGLLGNSDPTVQPNASIGANDDEDAGWQLITQGYEPYTNDVEVGNSGDYYGVKFNVGGIYEWRFHCTLGSNSATQGTILTIHACKNAEALTAYCYRVLQIERDNYGVEYGRSAENVAMGGPIFVEAGDVLNFRNTSAYAVQCTAVFCEVRRVGP